MNYHLRAPSVSGVFAVCGPQLGEKIPTGRQKVSRSLRKSRYSDLQTNMWPWDAMSVHRVRLRRFPGRDSAEIQTAHARSKKTLIFTMCDTCNPTSNIYNIALFCWGFCPVSATTMQMWKGFNFSPHIVWPIRSLSGLPFTPLQSLEPPPLCLHIWITVTCHNIGWHLKRWRVGVMSPTLTKQPPFWSLGLALLCLGTCRCLHNWITVTHHRVCRQLSVLRVGEKNNWRWIQTR